jgi:hypothetical protein
MTCTKGMWFYHKKSARMGKVVDVHLDDTEMYITISFVDDTERQTTLNHLRPLTDVESNIRDRLPGSTTHRELRKCLRNHRIPKDLTLKNTKEALHQQLRKHLFEFFVEIDNGHVENINVL